MSGVLDNALHLQYPWPRAKSRARKGHDVAAGGRGLGGAYAGESADLRRSVIYDWVALLREARNLAVNVELPAKVSLPGDANVASYRDDRLLLALHSPYKFSLTRVRSDFCPNCLTQS